MTSLLLVSLRRATHQAFFGCPEYLVLPSMLSAPVFYAKVC